MEQKVSIYNPFIGAYCEIPISEAEKFIKSAAEVEEKIKKIKKEKK